MLRLSTKPLILDLKNLKKIKRIKNGLPPLYQIGCPRPLAKHESGILPETCRHMACQGRFEYPMGPQTCPDRPYVNTSHQIWWLLLESTKKYQIRSYCHDFCGFRFKNIWKMLKLSTNPLISHLKNLKNLKNLKMVCPPWVRLGVWALPDWA